MWLAVIDGPRDGVGLKNLVADQFEPRTGKTSAVSIVSPQYAFAVRLQVVLRMVKPAREWVGGLDDGPGFESGGVDIGGHQIAGYQEQ